MNTDCCVDFNEYLNEQLKDPEFAKGMERASKKLKLELELNELLRKRGQNNMFFVEVKDIDDY